uniref:Ras-GEF domain-containing protein n=1 Tax=Macrostomum lignano TaxID=282301 RepID=A0A1I8J5X5_9PLAT
REQGDTLDLAKYFPARVAPNEAAFYMNFDCLLKCLRAVLLPDLQSINDWFSELKEDQSADFLEYYLFARFSNNLEQLQHAHKRMRESYVTRYEEVVEIFQKIDRLLPNSLVSTS